MHRVSDSGVYGLQKEYSFECICRICEECPVHGGAGLFLWECVPFSKDRIYGIYKR